MKIQKNFMDWRIWIVQFMGDLCKNDSKHTQILVRQGTEVMISIAFRPELKYFFFF